MIVPVLLGLGALWGAYEFLIKPQQAQTPPPLPPPPPPPVRPPVQTPVVLRPPATPPDPKPPTPSELAEARAMAEAVDADVRAKLGRYDQNLVRSFQSKVRLWGDGLYGPKTAGAVAHFTQREPPKPIYSSRDGNRTPVPYTPPPVTPLA